MKNDQFVCLQSDINLMSSDVICIASSQDDMNVNLKDFDILGRMDTPHQQKLIIYKKKEFDRFEVEMYETSSYQSVLCHLTSGIVCFLYINEDTNSFKHSYFMKRISEYSTSGQLLSIIGGMKIQSEVITDSSVTFVNIFNNLNVKSTIRHNDKGELDYVFMKDDIDSSKYSTGSFANLYSDHRALFLRLYSGINDVFHCGNLEPTQQEEAWPGPGPRPRPRPRA